MHENYVLFLPVDILTVWCTSFLRHTTLSCALICALRLLDILLECTLLLIFILSQFDGSLGLDYFIAKINTDYLDSLTDGAGKPLGIKPIDLTDTVDVSEGHVVSVIQHPKGQPRSISYFTVTRVIGKLFGYKWF